MAAVVADAPFFTAEDFLPTHDGRATPEARGRVAALAADLDAWAGAHLHLERGTRSEAEVLWWPRPAWRTRPGKDGPTVRLALGYLGGQPRLEHPALYVAAEWPSWRAVHRLMGTLGPSASHSRQALAKERMLRILAAARAEGLPHAGPSWWVRRVDPSSDQYIRTLAVISAIEREHDALDELAWDDLVALVGEHFPHPHGLSPHPKIALIWQYERRDLEGATLQEVVERIAPALIHARMAVEETMQPYSDPHPLVGAVHAGVSFVNDIGDYPSGRQSSPAPWEEDERRIIAAASGRALARTEHHRADILLAHAQEWRRLKGIGLSGVAEILEWGTR
jgi:hypothetical protein